MQNKCNCGCECQPGSGQGFVPVNGNWDFNMDHGCECQQNYARRNRRNNDCGCDEYEKAHKRSNKDDCRSGSDSRSGSDCQCERCEDYRKVECCDQNTYVRDMDECKDRGRNNGCQKCDECESDYGRGRSGCSGKDDCQCETCTRNRRGGNGCNECKHNDGYNRSYAKCDKDNATTYARSGKNRTVGMVKVERQEIDEIFESESALRAGTLFPELHKPMNGYCPYDSNCGTCKQAAAFAAWELRLYLNTHPHDKEALALFRKLCQEAEDTNYATTFLKDECCTGAWNWVKNPWPWEYDCKCGD